LANWILSGTFFIKTFRFLSKNGSFGRFFQFLANIKHQAETLFGGIARACIMDFFQQGK